MWQAARDFDSLASGLSEQLRRAKDRGQPAHMAFSCSPQLLAYTTEQDTLYINRLLTISLHQNRPFCSGTQNANFPVLNPVSSWRKHTLSISR
jgi:hypothetical protein